MLDRRQILTSQTCGCFYCLKTFPPTDITQWVDPDEVSGIGQTALCPYCSVDAVVGFPDGYKDIHGHLKRRKQQSFGQETRNPRRYGRIPDSSIGNGAWPHVIVGAIALAMIAMFILSGGHQSALNSLALPVTIPAILLGNGLAICIPPVLFIIYNLCILRAKMTKMSTPGQIMTGILICVIAALSAWFYTSGWQYRGVYVNSATVDAWVIFNCLLAATSVTLLIQAVKRKSPETLVMAHLALFVWFFTYAFPWLGEMI